MVLLLLEFSHRVLLTLFSVIVIGVRGQATIDEVHPEV